MTIPLQKTALALALCSLAVTAGCAGCDETGVLSVVPDIEVAPTTLDLGEVPFGVERQGTVTIRNLGNGPLTLTSVRLSDETLFRLQKHPGDVVGAGVSDVAVIAANAPEVVGTYMTTLIIESDDPDEPLEEVPVRLVAVAPPPCDDGNQCTEDWFDTDTSECRHRFADGLTCFPADKCIIDAVCSQGVCLGRQKTCDDNSACTRDYCRQIDGECLFIEDASTCDDGNDCTFDSCNAQGCQHENLPSGEACDDDDLCTVADACFQGACVGRGVREGEACDDSDSCTTGDTCLSGVCTGQSIVDPTQEGDVVFTYPLINWPSGAFLHRREVSMSRESSVFYGLDHLRLPNDEGLTHVVFAMNQCGSDVYQFSYRPPDAHVLVSYVRRGIQIGQNDLVRMYVGVRQRPQDGYEPQTTTYLLDRTGQVLASGVQTLGGETGRSLLPDGSHIYGVIWPLTQGAPTAEDPARQNLVIVREDVQGNVLWRHERTSEDWAEFLGVAGPRVLFWANGRFGALDFNTGAQVWSQPTAVITKEMALSTDLNLGVARASYQLIGVEILEGNQIFEYPTEVDASYFPRTDPVISADGRILVLMERRNLETQQSEGLDWVELDRMGNVISSTRLPYEFPGDCSLTRHEDYYEDPYPTVADDGVAYVGYGDTFFALNPGGGVRWTVTSTIPNAYTGTVPVLRDDGVILFNEKSRAIIGVRSNGGRMSDAGWASFRHDGDRTNFTP
ncbi:MAG: PQQ-binding-like beta-propeller repeat protein [Myxococcales bacterium]|nr:PQQ-binding-like beta-propeller repeat protein [Myxococcales bacterium]